MTEEIGRRREMSIGGIGAAGYPMAECYVSKRAGKGAAAADHTQQNFENVQQSQMAGGMFELHISNDQDGEAVSAICGADHSLTIYKPKDFDPENPVYKAKIWDKDGNVTERMVDVSQVDPRNSDYIDMFAYASHLSASGECPSAQSSFVSAAAIRHGQSGRSYEDLYQKADWAGALAEAMQMQYQAGNIEGYLDYKPFWDFLQNKA